MNFTAPEMTPTLACRVIFFFNERVTKGYIDRGRHHEATGQLREEGRARTGVEKKGNHFGVEGKYIGDHSKSI